MAEQKRRRHYGDATELVAAWIARDPSVATFEWLQKLEAAYRRLPALRAALDRPGEASMSE